MPSEGTPSGTAVGVLHGVGADGEPPRLMLSQITRGLLDSGLMVPEPGSSGRIGMGSESVEGTARRGFGVSSKGFMGGGLRSAALGLGAERPGCSAKKTPDFRTAGGGVLEPGNQGGLEWVREFVGGDGSAGSVVERGSWAADCGRRSSWIRVECLGCSAKKPPDFRTAVEEGFRSRGNPGRIGMGFGVRGEGTEEGRARGSARKDSREN